ncbi:AAA family ATPase [Leptothoe sp. LEGE 181152]|nr:AAA family ATPase [Leptothoe sp. LEGE 181152]
MKVKSISIRNFKRFETLDLSFENQVLDEISDRYLILGDNGTGKTTLLQAIALPLALATRRITDIADFNWSGFLPGRYWRNGAPKIELTVTFTPAERQATRDIAHRWYANQPDDLRSSHPFVSLKPCTNESFLDENFTVLKVYQN